MKRFFIAATFLLSLQIVKANTLTAADSSVRAMRGGYAPNTVKDSVTAVQAGMYSNSIFKHRLDSIQKDVSLDYNEYVQNYIDIYTRHKDEMSHVLALSKYYFPIYEKIFREAGIPPEIKYLSIVESKLDPTAVSKVGATGPWQFMSTTAKNYGLNMNEYIDERRDPIQASYAAAAYLKDAYQEFGDWLLAIASYNCGKSSVERAIAKAGAMDFWTIRQYLPAETRNYVPAYIAISYVMNYAGKHNIQPDNWTIAAKTDTVLVDQFVTLASVARALNTDVNNLVILNPAYKRQIVNGTNASLRKIIIPSSSHRNFTALYNALNNIAAPVVIEPEPPAPVVTPAPVLAAAPVNVVKTVPGTKTPDFYIVKKGETLADVAANHGLEVRELQTWNHISSVTEGQRVKLNPFARL
jgi:membrane-bound lytic murein transglycosylase D